MAPDLMTDAEAAVAVFDVDETLITVKSMFRFLAFHLERRHGREDGRRHYASALAELEEARRRSDRSTVNRAFWRLFRGEPLSALVAEAEAWVADETREAGFFNDVVRERLAEEREAGRAIVYLSGSADFILRPIVARLGGGEIVAIRLETREGVCTGEIVGIQTIGAGKCAALLAHLAATGRALEGSSAYGDHLSDLPFLELATHPHVIAGDPDLTSVAAARGWPILPAGRDRVANLRRHP